MVLKISHKAKIAISKSQKQKVKKTPQKKDIDYRYNVTTFLSKLTNKMTKQLKNYQLKLIISAIINTAF